MSVDVATGKAGQRLKGEQIKGFKTTRTPGAGAYILERTRTLFTGRYDEPCSRAVRLAPTDSEAGSRCFADSGVGPLLPAGSKAALCSLGSSGSRPLLCRRSALDPRRWRGKCAHLGLRHLG
jgi:hypothetical protein